MHKKSFIFKKSCIDKLKQKKIWGMVLGVILAFVFVYLLIGINSAMADDNPLHDFDDLCNEYNNSNYLNQDRNITSNSPVSNSSYEQAIKDNINEQYVRPNTFESATIMVLKQTIANKDLLNGINTLDGLQVGSINDAELGMFDSYCVLYNLDEDSDYYVALVNTTEGDVLDVAFARNNYNGEVLDDCIYDYEKGLAYIPKKYTKGMGEQGKESILEMQMQMLIAVYTDDDKKVGSTIQVSLDKGNNHYETNLKANLLDTNIVVPVGNINTKNINILVNDNINVNDKSVYDDGRVYIQESPTNIKSIKITTETPTLLTTITNVFKQDSLSTSLDDIPCLPYTLNKDLAATSGGNFNYVGAKFNAIMTVHYDETPSSAPYQECLYGVNGFVTDENMQTFANCIWSDAGDVDLSNLKEVSNRIYNLFTFYPHSVIKEGTDGLALKCGHIGTPAAHDEDNKEVRTKILAINEERQYALLGFVTATAGYTKQGACGIYKVKYESKGGCQMWKDSTCDWSKTNPNYSLEGAKYDIYNDSNCQSYTGVSIVLDKNGYGHTANNVLESKKTYYVREDKNNTGVNYLYNDAIGSVYIANTNSYENNIQWNTGQTTYDIPCEDPAPVKLVKADAQTGEPGTTEGDVPSFENAHYDYEFYTDYFKLKSEIDSHKASYQRHWVMATDKNGLTCVSEQYRNYKVSGDDFYENQDGVIACPLGSYVVHEVKAPDGYLLSEKTYIIHVVSDKSVSWGTKTIIYDADTGIGLEKIVDPHTGDIATKALEQVKKGDYKFVKKEPEEQQTMAYIPWKITSKSTGEWHVVVTDRNGEVNTSSEKTIHTENTNYFDSLLTQSGEVPKSGIDEEKIKTFFEAGKFAGTWFCWDKEKNKYIPPTVEDNKLGALYYDDYYLEELPVSANKDYKLVSRIFNISQHDWIVDGGTITDNPEETVHITTYAYNFETSDKTLYLSDKETLIDIVSYDDLKKGNEYTLVGVLYDKSTLQPLHDSLGNIFTEKTTFKADDDTGNAYMYFNINTLSMPNKNIVVYEKLFNYEGELLATHEDITDWAQTVNTVPPDVKTYLLNSEGTKDIVQDANTKLTDYVDYNYLKPGKTYYLDGKIVNKTDGSTVATSSKMVVPVATSGRDSVDFILDTTQFKTDTELVAFETLRYEDVVVGGHSDMNDAEQTVKLKAASITTNLHIDKSYSHVIERTTACSVIDTISYDGLAVGNSYTIKGKLIDKKTGNVFVDCSGKTIEIEETRIADKKSGTWDVNYLFDSSTLEEGTEIVCFEYVSINDVEIATHTDLKDEKQTVTVYVPSMYISTEARGGSKEDKLYAIEDETLIDRVSYTNVEKGFLYSLTGTLMDRTTGLPLTDSSGQIITVTEQFITTGTSGQYEMRFKLDARQLQGKQITVFEKLYDHTGVLRASHEDLTDDYQSIDIPYASVKTELLQTITGSHELQRYADNKVEDIIAYKGLCPGKTYYAEGILMNIATGMAYINEITGHGVTASLEFIPTEENSDVKITYLFDSTLMSEDEELVSFVTLHQGATINNASKDIGDTSVIVVNDDINDPSETVIITTPKVTTNATYDDGNKYFIARHDSVAHDSISWSNLPINKEITAYSWFVYEDSGLPVTDGLIDPDKAQIATDDLVYALGGMVTVCNCEWTNRWEVQFRQLTNKVKEEKLANIDLETLSHVMYTSKKFVPETKIGETSIDFKFDSAATGAGKITALTVLVSDNTVVASHTDIEDINEQMEILRSNIFTKFADVNGKKTIEPTGRALLVDHVEYFTVIPGKEYKLHGKVINKSNEEVVAENEIRFTPEQASGDIDIPFELDATQLSGLDIVCYETLYLEGTEACVHEDINDADQTVHVNGISPGSLAQTGDDTRKLILFILIALLLAAGLYVGYKMEKKLNYYDVYVPEESKGGKMDKEEQEVNVENLDIDDTPEEIIEEEIELK